MNIWSDVIKPIIFGIKSDQHENIKQLLKDTELHNWTYYGSQLTGREIGLRLKFLEGVKYRIMLPAMNIVNMVCGKRLRAQADIKGVQDTQLRAFERALQNAKETYALEYLYNLRDRDPKRMKEDYQKIMNSKAMRTIDSMVMLLGWFAHNDDAYHVFADILMLEIAKEVGHDVKDGKLAYLIPRGRYVNDIFYLTFAKIMQSGEPFLYDPKNNIARNPPKEVKP